MEALFFLFFNNTFELLVACVASVSVGFGSKELRREKWSENPKIPFRGTEFSRGSISLHAQTIDHCHL